MQGINNTTPLSSLLPSNTSNVEHSDLKNKISDVTCSTSSPKESISASFNESFSTSFNKKSLDFLFSSSGKEAALRDIFLNSNNTYAKSEIIEFSNVLYSLVHQNDLQFDNEPGLQKIVNQYSDLILKDKLSKDSVFGPWSAKNKKAHALRQNIEHRLAQLAQKHTSGEALSLGQKLLNTEVSSFIKNDILGELKLNNDVLSSLNLDDLIDSQAKLAFDSLREHRRSIIENSGFGIGKLSRDLNTVAILPELLKKVFTDITNDLKEQHPTPSSQGPSAPAPDEPDSGLKHDTNTPSQPVIHYHINNDNRTYDNRVFDNRVFDNSFHEFPTNETPSKPSQVNDPLYTGSHSNGPSTLADKVISVHPRSVSDATQTFSDNPELERSPRSGKATSDAQQKQTGGNTPSANSASNAAPGGNPAAAPDNNSVNPGNSFFRGHWTLNVQDSANSAPRTSGPASGKENSSATASLSGSPDGSTNAASTAKMSANSPAGNSTTTSDAQQKQTGGNTPSANSASNAAPGGNPAAAPDNNSVNPGNSFFRGHWTLNVQDSANSAPRTSGSATKIQSQKLTDSTNSTTSKNESSRSSVSHEVSSTLNKSISGTKIPQLDSSLINDEQSVKKETIYEASKKVSDSLSSLLSSVEINTTNKNTNTQTANKNTHSPSIGNAENKSTNNIYEAAKNVTSALSQVLNKINKE